MEFIDDVPPTELELAIGPLMNDAELVGKVLAWLSERRKPDTAGSPMPGFGPQGLHTLYLPSIRSDTVIAFKDGVPTEVEVPGADEIPGLADLRNQILAGCKQVESVVFDVPKLLLVYAAKLIKVNYSVSDADLAFLLVTEKMLWANAIIRHVLGGENIARKLASTGSDDFSSACLALEVAKRNERERLSLMSSPRRSKLRRALSRIRFWN